MAVEVPLNTFVPIAQLSEELQHLTREAIRIHENAYCAYSNFAVGAALLHEDNAITAGCNYENCVLKGCCAENCAIVKANAEGRRTAKAVAVYGSNKAPGASTVPPDTITPPCGVCRQCILEVAEISQNFESFLVILVTHDRERVKIFKLSDLIPLRFGPASIGMDLSKWSRCGGV